MASRPDNAWPVLVRLLAFLAATITLTGFIAMQIARIDTSDSYRVVAAFDDVSGLMEGDRVKIGGAPVGRVEGIEVRKGRAEVTLSVRDRHRLPSDSEAAIRWRNPIGQRMVYLLPGTGAAMLKDGDRIARTRSVVDLGELINQLAPLTRSLDPKQINQLMGSVYQALEGNEGNVGQLVANIDQLSSTIASRRHTLQQALRDFATVSEVLGRRDKQIAQMTDNLVTLSDAFVDNRGLIDQALVQLAAMVRSTDKVLAGNAGELEEVVQRLAAVMGGTSRNLNRLGPVLKGTGPKMTRLFDLVNEGEYFVGAAPCLTLATGPCPYRTRVAKFPTNEREPESAEDILPGLPQGGN
jgi:phospholipid/cholesterol/gamma-HCH transport system substrate-binding protein